MRTGCPRACRPSSPATHVRERRQRLDFATRALQMRREPRGDSDPAANDKGEDRRQHAKSRTASASAHSPPAGVRSRRPKITHRPTHRQHQGDPARGCASARTRAPAPGRAAAPYGRGTAPTSTPSGVTSTPSGVASPPTPVKAAKVSTVVTNTTGGRMCRRPSPSTMCPCRRRLQSPPIRPAALGRRAEVGAELRDAHAARPAIGIKRRAGR